MGSILPKPFFTWVGPGRGSFLCIIDSDAQVGQR